MPDAGKWRRRSSARSLNLGPLPSEHKLVKAKKIVTEWDHNRNAKAHMAYQDRCLACKATAVQYAQATRESGKTTRKPPVTTGTGRQTRTVRHAIPQATTACRKCHVHRCARCFGDPLWDRVPAQVCTVRDSCDWMRR